MSTAQRPRHARKEIRDFADWLAEQGWVFETTDASGHTIWSHPATGARYKLPETPTHFNVRRARRDVLKLMGQRAAGKRRTKVRAIVTDSDAAEVEAARRRHEDRLRADRVAEQRRREREEAIVARARRDADEDRHRHEIEALMRPGWGR